MSRNARQVWAVGDEEAAADRYSSLLDAVFAALSDPLRRQIMERLETESLMVTELASPFGISKQGVSKHIQVLVRAGLVQQERTGRISRCSLDVGPLLDAAVWMNRYTRYWQAQFDLLAATLQGGRRTSNARKHLQRPAARAVRIGVPGKRSR